MLHFILGLLIGFIIMSVVCILFGESPIVIKINSSFKNYPKICKNCNNFVPCVNSVGDLKGACRICSIETYHFDLNMSCGHFEYTEAIQNQIDKKHLEKCFKK